MEVVVDDDGGGAAADDVVVVVVVVVAVGENMACLHGMKTKLCFVAEPAR